MLLIWCGLHMKTIFSKTIAKIPPQRYFIVIKTFVVCSDRTLT